MTPWRLQRYIIKYNYDILPVDIHCVQQVHFSRLIFEKFVESDQLKI